LLYNLFPCSRILHNWKNTLFGIVNYKIWDSLPDYWKTRGEANEEFGNTQCAQAKVFESEIGRMSDIDNAEPNRERT